MGLETSGSGQSPKARTLFPSSFPFASHGKHDGDPRVPETVEDKMLVERGQLKGAGRQKLDIRGGREKGVFRCQKLANLIP